MVPRQLPWHHDFAFHHHCYNKITTNNSKSSYKLQLLVPLFPQVRCDGVPDDLIMGCLELWLVVNFVWFCMSLQNPNMIPFKLWFSIGMSNMDVISTYFIIFLHISTYFHSCSIHFPSFIFAAPYQRGGVCNSWGCPECPVLFSAQDPNCDKLWSPGESRQRCSACGFFFCKAHIRGALGARFGTWSFASAIALVDNYLDHF